MFHTSVFISPNVWRAGDFTLCWACGKAKLPARCYGMFLFSSKTYITITVVQNTIAINTICICIPIGHKNIFTHTTIIFTIKFYWIKKSTRDWNLIAWFFFTVVFYKIWHLIRQCGLFICFYFSFYFFRFLSFYLFCTKVQFT